MNRIKNPMRRGTALLALAALLLTGTLVFWVSCRQKEERQVIGNGAEKRQTILVAGQDRTTGLCDVLMLISVDRANGRTALLSLPRDTFAAYNDGSYCKLNGAMQALGGMDGLCSFLEESMGIAVDRYLLMDPDALRVAVDAIGGVEVTLSEPMNYEDPAQGLSIHLPVGTQTLDGRSAEQFVRFRADYAKGDLGRIDAQKLFLVSCLRSFRTKATLPVLLKLATMVPEHTETNLSLHELVSLAKTALATDSDRVTFFTLPGKACTVKQTGASYYVLSAPATSELLVNSFGAETGAFDPKEVFCHHRNASFCEIYKKYIPYEGSSMAQIEEKGIQIERIP